MPVLETKYRPPIPLAANPWCDDATGASDEPRTTIIWTLTRRKRSMILPDDRCLSEHVRMAGQVTERPDDMG